MRKTSEVFGDFGSLTGSFNRTMIYVFTLVIVLGVAAAQYRNGIFTSITMLIQVVLAGLIASCFFEPVADELDSMFQGGRFAGFEDCIALALLFAGSLLG